MPDLFENLTTLLVFQKAAQILKICSRKYVPDVSLRDRFYKENVDEV